MTAVAPLLREPRRAKQGSQPVASRDVRPATYGSHAGGRPRVQRLPRVSEPGDPLEREAVGAAQRIVAGQRVPDVTLAGGGAHRLAVGEEERPDPDDRQVQRVAVGEQELSDEPVRRTVDRLAVGRPTMTAGVAGALRDPGPGGGVPDTVRSAIEPQLGVSLADLRVHDDAPARQVAARLQARALTYGPHVFLGAGESAHDLPLMAHEATHAVQQGALGGGPAAAAGVDEVHLLPAVITERLASYARHVPGYTLVAVLVGYDPLRGERVERSATNLVGGLLGLVPFGTAVYDKLVELGVVDQALAFVERQLATFDLSLDRLERLITQAWDAMDFVRLDPFDYNLAVLTRTFTGLLQDVVRFVQSLLSELLDMVKRAVVDAVEPLLAENRAWALVKKVLHVDPLRGVPVQATTVEILEDFLLLIGRETELEQMRARGVLQEAAAWIDTQLSVLASLGTDLGALLSAAWAAIQPANLPDLMGNIRALVADAAALLRRAWDFAGTVAAKVLELVKKALLSWLSDVAHETPGFHLVTVILGRNPFTGDVVPRSATNLLRGFITLLPNGQAVFDQLSESGVIGQAAANIEGAVAGLGISWAMATGLFRSVWDSLSIDDLVDPLSAFQRVRDQFGEPIARLFVFVRVVLREVFQLVLTLMNFPTDMLGRIVANVVQAFEDIRRDPIGFLLNLLAAVKEGFTRFLGGIVDHLLGGLTGWLFRGLQAAGIQPPTELTLRSGLDLLLQVLGITAERLWQKLGERIGPERVAQIRGAIDRLTGIWTFIRDVQESGVSAVWTYVEGQLANLWDTIIGHVRTWIMDRIVNQVTARLLSMLDPTGVMAVINSFVAFFNAVQSAIEYARELLGIVDRFVGTVAAVARGDIVPGAVMLEQGLIAAVPVAIGFLANQVGLGSIGDKIAEIMAGLRELVDQALDWLLDQAQRLLQSVMNALGFGAEPPAGVDPNDHAAMAAQAVRDVQAGPPAADYATLRAQKEAQAREVEQRYTPMLQPGIGLRITFPPAPADAADADLDFTVTIAPNDTTDTGSVSLAGGAAGAGAAVQAGDPVVIVDENRSAFADEVNQVVTASEAVVHGIWVRIPSGGRRFLQYRDYVGEGGRDLWRVDPVPGFVPFQAHGGPGSGGRVIIDNPHLGTEGTRAYIPPSARAESGYDPQGNLWNRAGHLVAKMFGGPGAWSTGNVVAMTERANHTAAGMPGVENRVRDDMRSNALAVYDYSVSPVYASSQTPPIAVDIALIRRYPTPQLPSTLAAAMRVDNTAT